MILKTTILPTLNHVILQPYIYICFDSSGSVFKSVFVQLSIISHLTLFCCMHLTTCLRSTEHTRKLCSYRYIVVNARWLIWQPVQDLTVQLVWPAGTISVMSSNSTVSKFLYQLLIYNLLYQRRNSVMIIIYITSFMLNTSDYLSKIMRSSWLITTKGNCSNVWHRAKV